MLGGALHQVEQKVRLPTSVHVPGPITAECPNQNHMSSNQGKFLGQSDLIKLIWLLIGCPLLGSQSEGR